MAIEFIPTRIHGVRPPALNAIIDRLQQSPEQLGSGNAILYYGWPKFFDYESSAHSADLAILAQQKGLILVRYIANAGDPAINEFDESIVQAAAFAEAQMLKSPRLRQRNRRLKFNVLPVLYAPGAQERSDLVSELASSEASLLHLISAYENESLTVADLDEARSVLEGAKALGRATRRRVSDPEKHPAAAALAKLEEEIATFDTKQRYVALTALSCPQRIRGLAGSGKTVILAMKAALAHIFNPNDRILVTYHTRSLRDHLTRLITRFYRHFAEGDPDWRMIDIQHGWGRKDTPGVYRETCLLLGITPLNFADARNRSAEPFDYVCKTLLKNHSVPSIYDVILIDEGQDFPQGFYQLCYFLAKGNRDEKHIIWAYDELQNIFDVRVRSAEELFGTDTDKLPRISLSRSRPSNAETNDFVLPKCYRNQRDVLILAHAIGFGLYGQAVQMLQNEEHWADVGYTITKGHLIPGHKVVIDRPADNNPTRLDTNSTPPLLVHCGFFDFDDEVEHCIREIESFLGSGLEPHDLMVIAIDDRAARGYLAEVSRRLAERDIACNNIIADKFTEPPFTIEGRVTLTTVYRAKGNEAAVVLVLGCDAVPLETRGGRNRLFTAFTRTKGWLRVFGCKPSFDALEHEIDQAIQYLPRLHFTMPDPERIETIQRDLADRDARYARAREELFKLQDELGLTDSDMRALLGTGHRNGKGRI